MSVRVLAVALCCVLALAGRARAEDKPWARGVSEQDQERALVLYRAGNALFERDQYREALAEYERALEVWDHPAIRYNAAVCLIHLERVIEAYEHLAHAMRYGPAPLGPELYQEGLDYEQRLARQLAELEVSCDEPGAEITLDGKPLFVGPGSARRRVLTGAHQIVATKPTHATETRSITLAPGDKLRLAITMTPRESPRRLTRRWDAWKPWAVVAAGGTVALAGGALYGLSWQHFGDYDDAIAALPPGTASTRTAKDLRDRAELERIGAYSALAVGGAVLATGLVLVVVNQPRLAPVVTPDVGSERAGLVISGRW